MIPITFAPRRENAAAGWPLSSSWRRRGQRHANQWNENLPGNPSASRIVSEDAGKTPTPGEKSRGCRASITRRHRTPIIHTVGATPARHDCAQDHDADGERCRRGTVRTTPPVLRRNSTIKPAGIFRTTASLSLAAPGALSVYLSARRLFPPFPWR